MIDSYGVDLILFGLVCFASSLFFLWAIWIGPWAARAISAFGLLFCSGCTFGAFSYATGVRAGETGHHGHMHNAKLWRAHEDLNWPLMWETLDQIVHLGAFLFVPAAMAMMLYLILRKKP